MTKNNRHPRPRTNFWCSTCWSLHEEIQIPDYSSNAAQCCTQRPIGQRRPSDDDWDVQRSYNKSDLATRPFRRTLQRQQSHHYHSTNDVEDFGRPGYDGGPCRCLVRLSASRRGCCQDRDSMTSFDADSERPRKRPGPPLKRRSRTLSRGWADPRGSSWQRWGWKCTVSLTSERPAAGKKVINHRAEMMIWFFFALAFWQQSG